MLSNEVTQLKHKGINRSKAMELIKIDFKKGSEMFNKLSKDYPELKVWFDSIINDHRN